MKLTRLPLLLLLFLPVSCGKPDSEKEYEDFAQRLIDKRKARAEAMERELEGEKQKLAELDAQAEVARQAEIEAFEEQRRLTERRKDAERERLEQVANEARERTSRAEKEFDRSIDELEDALRDLE